MKTSVISASRTLDGSPVYLSSDGMWVDDFNEAMLVTCSEALEAALTSARSQEEQVCDPFAIAVVEEAGQRRSTQGKWTLRAHGAERMLRDLGYTETMEADDVSI